MSFLDHYIKHDLGFRFYGRYVDDFFLIHHDKSYLLDCKKKIEAFLAKELHLVINPKKVYLQSVYMGVKFFGVDIKPGHANMSRRILNNFNQSFKKINKISINHKLNKKELENTVSSINSYLGMCSHYNTFNLRKSNVFSLDNRVLNRLVVATDLSKINIKD